MEFSVLLEKMLIFIALMLIAYVMARRGILGSDFTRTASKLVVDVFLTGTILSSMITTGSEQSLASIGKIVIMTFVIQLIGYAVAAFAMRFVQAEENRAAPCPHPEGACVISPLAEFPEAGDPSDEAPVPPNQFESRFPTRSNC